MDFRQQDNQPLMELLMMDTEHNEEDDDLGDSSSVQEPI
jgi:hypothetical protein